MWPEEGDFPENVLHRVVYVIINRCSFESFMCLEKQAVSLVISSLIGYSLTDYTGNVKCMALYPTLFTGIVKYVTFYPARFTGSVKYDIFS